MDTFVLGAERKLHHRWDSLIWNKTRIYSICIISTSFQWIYDVSFSFFFTSRKNLTSRNSGRPHHRYMSDSHVLYLCTEEMSTKLRWISFRFDFKSINSLTSIMLRKERDILYLIKIYASWHFRVERYHNESFERGWCRQLYSWNRESIPQMSVGPHLCLSFLTNNIPKYYDKMMEWVLLRFAHTHPNT